MVINKQISKEIKHYICRLKDFADNHLNPETDNFTVLAHTVVFESSQCKLKDVTSKHCLGRLASFYHEIEGKSPYGTEYL